jgi:hypothetical protein
MKSEFTFEIKKEKNKFPKLMIYDDGSFVVLFFNETGSGALISFNENSSYNHLEYSNDWDITEFKEFNGKVVLTN